MQTIEAIRRRVNNAEDLLSIVRTMKTLAAVNIRQYEKAVEALVDYNRTIEMGFQIILRDRPDEIIPARTDHPARAGVVIFGSDQGMCGQFNEQITQFSLAQLDRLQVQKPDRLILALGVRLIAYLDAIGVTVDEARSIPGSMAAITEMIQDIVVKIDGWHSHQGVSRVFLFYNHPLTGAAYRPHWLSLLPVKPENFRYLAEQTWESRSVPIYTMEWQQLFSALLRQYLFVSLYRAFAESLMSENASRLATMQAAERNIKDHLEELNALFHQQRQRMITEELLDIVSGFEALADDKRTDQ